MVIAQTCDETRLTLSIRPLSSARNLSIETYRARS
jgi:hypothetical protein